MAVNARTAGSTHLRAALNLAVREASSSTTGPAGGCASRVRLDQSPWATETDETAGRPVERQKTRRQAGSKTDNRDKKDVFYHLRGKSMRGARGKTLALAVAVGTAIGVGGASTAQAAPASATPGAIGAPAADGCRCDSDRSDFGFDDFAFDDFGFDDFGSDDFGFGDFGDSLFGRSALAGRRFLPWGFNFGGARRFGAPGQFQIGHGFGVPGQFGAPGGQGYGAGQFGAPGGQGRGRAHRAPTRGRAHHAPSAGQFGAPGGGQGYGAPSAGQFGAPGGQGGGYGSPG
jgi:hypothetical protein